MWVGKCRTPKLCCCCYCETAKSSSMKKKSPVFSIAPTMSVELLLIEISMGQQIFISCSLPRKFRRRGDLNHFAVPEIWMIFLKNKTCHVTQYLCYIPNWMSSFKFGWLFCAVFAHSSHIVGLTHAVSCIFCDCHCRGFSHCHTTFSFMWIWIFKFENG